MTIMKTAYRYSAYKSKGQKEILNGQTRFSKELYSLLHDSGEIARPQSEEAEVAERGTIQIAS